MSLSAYIIQTLALINDIFVAYSSYNAPYLSQHGLVLFIFMQSQITGSRFAKTYQESQRLFYPWFESVLKWHAFIVDEGMEYDCVNQTNIAKHLFHSF